MKPDFIGIGAARSGTTWIFKQLEMHPDIWQPRIKELQFFSRSPGYFGPSHLSQEGRLPKLIGLSEGSHKYRIHFFRALGSNLLRPSYKKLRWDANYFFRRPTIEWYKNLFNDGGDLLSGEITPQYSVLTRWDIQNIKSNFPDVKIFFIMRDPVERAWSLIKYHEKRGKKRLGVPPA